MKKNVFRITALMALMMMTMTTFAQSNDSITAQRFDLTLGVQRDFNLRCLGMLTLDVRCVDVLNTNKTEAVIYGIRELSTANPARRTFLINLNWKFNEARSKYRGSGAGEKQKARM